MTIQPTCNACCRAWLFAAIIRWAQRDLLWPYSRHTLHQVCRLVLLSSAVKILVGYFFRFVTGSLILASDVLLTGTKTLSRNQWEWISAGFNLASGPSVIKMRRKSCWQGRPKLLLQKSKHPWTSYSRVNNRTVLARRRCFDMCRSRRQIPSCKHPQTYVFEQ